MKITASIAALMSILILGSAVHAQEQGTKELAKAAQNPIANLISVPFQNNTNFKLGPQERTKNVLNIQPVYPITLNEDWNLITRTIFPLVSTPTVDGIKLVGDSIVVNPVTGIENDRVFGLGDTTFSAFFSPSNSGRVTWGVGPIALLPTATDDALGSDKWGLGATVVVLTMPGDWVVGSLFSNLWSTGGSGEQDINLFTWQYFVNYNIPGGNGLYLTSAPINTANWEAESGNQWTVPLGGGVGKIFRIGKQPINAQASAYYNVEKPKFGSDWQLRLQVQLMFPK